MTLVLLGVISASAAYFYYADELPKVKTLAQVHFRQPLRIYTRDGKLMAKYGVAYRETLDFEEIPPQLIHAFLGAEDNNFFDEPGVDWKGLLRAAINLALTGEKSQGGSTITMQLARNMFLTNVKTYERKFKEIILALRIDYQFSKQRILELYLNKIFLGKRAYGVAAAARVYYGKDLHDLTIAQMAMIAGLPQAPSTHNPIDDPEAAINRRNYVLRRMYQLHYISRETYQRARSQPVTAHVQPPPAKVEAYYVAEMIRQEMVERFGRQAYTKGLTVISTIKSGMADGGQRSRAGESAELRISHGVPGAGSADRSG